MNKTILIGRLTKDPEYHVSPSGTKMARYTIAVPRPQSQNADPNVPNADFINCKVFGNGADFAQKYLKKGTKIAVEGHIQTGSYTNQQGQKVYTTEVVIDRHEFCESKTSQGQQPQQYVPQAPVQQMPPQQPVQPVQQPMQQASVPNTPYATQAVPVQQATVPQAPVSQAQATPIATVPQVPDAPYVLPEDLPFN